MAKEKISRLDKLKKDFEKAGANPYQGGSENPRPKCAIFDEIGQLALKGDQDALKFLADNMTNEDHFIRYAAVGFLGDMPKEHLKDAGLNATQLISELIKREEKEKIIILAQRALIKISA